MVAEAPIFRLLAPTILVFAHQPILWDGWSVPWEWLDGGLKMSLTDRPAHDRGLRDGAFSWTHGSCLRLLGGDAAVGRSSYCLVRTWHSDFFLGCFAGELAGHSPSRPAPGRCGRRLWSALGLRSITVSPCHGSYWKSTVLLDDVPWAAFVRDLAEVALPGSSSGIKGFLAIERRIKLWLRLERRQDRGSSKKHDK